MNNICQDFIPNLPKIPFDRGVSGWIGIVAHSTATYETTVENERQYQVEHWDDAFTHFFVSDEKILQTASTDYKAYGAGKPANGRYLHIELLQSRDKNKFLKAYEKYVWLIAYLLVKKNLPVIDGKTLLSHKQVNDLWHSGDHTDPIAYLESHGVTWKQLVDDVKKSVYKQTAPVVPTCTPDEAVEFILGKIKSSDLVFWKRQARYVQYLDVLFQKIATAWMADNKSEFEIVKRLPPILPTVVESIDFIDSRVHLTNKQDWVVKSKNVKYLDLLFQKVCYVWRKELNL